MNRENFPRFYQFFGAYLGIWLAHILVLLGNEL
jgi:hypothetical protein